MTKARVGALVLMAGLLGACGSSGAGKATSVDVLSGAYANTQAAHSANTEMVARVTTANGQTDVISASGPVQWRPLLGSLTEHISAGPANLSLDCRIIGTNIYVQLPAQYASQLGGKSWLEASLTDLAGNTGFNQFDPTQMLALLTSHSNSVTKVGTEMVDGQSTTHYRAVEDLSKSASTPALQQMLPKLEAIMGTSQLPLDVWLDTSGRLVRFAMSLTLEQAPAGAQSGAAAAFPIHETITEDLSDYGTPVSASPPPAGQISPINLAQILQGEGL